MDENTAIGMCMGGQAVKRELLAHYAQSARISKIASERNENLECREIIAGVNPFFFKDIASQAGLSLKSVANLFRDSRVVKFFSKIKFSFKELYNWLKRGYSTMKDVQKALADYVKQSGIGRWTAKQLDSQRLREIDAWLKSHPKTKRVAGVLVGAMLVYIWFNMSFIGNPAFDFDMSTMLAAMAGKFALADIFSGASGAALLILFMTGLAGLSFPWPGPATAKFVLAIVGTIATKLKKRLKKASMAQENLMENVESGLVKLARELTASPYELFNGYEEEVRFWDGIYFHGKLVDIVEEVSDMIPGDLVGSDVPPPNEGVFDARVYGRKAKLYVWNRGRRGLVVLEGDKKARLYAEGALAEKKRFL